MAATRTSAALVRAANADVVSANWQVHDPTQGKVDSPTTTSRRTRRSTTARRCPASRTRGLRVVPYTINDEPTMQRVIDLGVDGIISDDPDTLLLVAKRNGLR